MKILFFIVVALVLALCIYKGIKNRINRKKREKIKRDFKRFMARERYSNDFFKHIGEI